MKHHVLGSLTAALVMSSFGAPLASNAQQVDETEPPPTVEPASLPEISVETASINATGIATPDGGISTAPPLEAKPNPEESFSSSIPRLEAASSPDPVSEPLANLAANTSVHSALTQPALISPDSTQPVPYPSPEPMDGSPGSAEDTLPELSSIHTELARLSAERNRLAFGATLVQAHAFDRRQAATLYFQNIPIMTFLGGELPTLEGGEAKALDRTPHTPADETERLLLKAQQIGDRLEQFYRDGGEAAQISARWDEDQRYFAVTLAGEDLVIINDSTILPDTTEDPAVDVLHIANRLRRLVGTVPPLTEVEGLPRPEVPPVVPDALIVTSVFTGMASWYGPGFHGRRSASGEIFNQRDLTAAHRTLPFGTEVRVTNLNTNQQVIVRINDRGPYAHGRVIDLSAAAAQAIGLTRAGVGPVRLEVLGRPQ